MSRYSGKSVKYVAVLILLVFATLILTSLVIMAEGTASDSTVDWERHTQNGETGIDGKVDYGSGADFGSATFEGAEPTPAPVERNDNGQAEPALIAVLAGVLGLGLLAGNMLKRSQIDALMPEGNGIWIPEEDREKVLEMINSLADKEYALDANGFVIGTGKEKNGSSTYSTIIDALIESDRKTVIGIDSGWVAYDGSETHRVSFGTAGRGVNVGDNDTDQVAVISGEAGSVKDVDGNAVYSGADMVLAHELIHAARGVYSLKTPGVTPEATREEEAYTIELENIIRAELGYGLRGDGSSMDDVNRDGKADGNDTYGRFTSDDIDSDWYKPLFEGDNDESSIYNMDEGGKWVVDGYCLFDGECGQLEDVAVLVYDSYCMADSACGHYEDHSYTEYDSYCVADSCGYHTSDTRTVMDSYCVADSCGHHENDTRTVLDSYCVRDSCGHYESDTRTVMDSYCAADSCGHHESDTRTVIDSYCAADSCGHYESSTRTVMDSYCAADSCGHYANSTRTVHDSYCQSDSCGHYTSGYHTVSDSYCVSDSCGHYASSYHTVHDSYCQSDSCGHYTSGYHTVHDSYCCSDSCGHYTSGYYSYYNSYYRSTITVYDGSCRFVSDSYCSADSCFHSAYDASCVYVKDSYCSFDSCSHSVYDSSCQYISDSYCKSDACYHTVYDGSCNYVSDGYCSFDSCTHTVTDTGCQYVSDSYCAADSCSHTVTDGSCKYVSDSYCAADSCSHTVTDALCKYVPDGYCAADSCSHTVIDSSCKYVADSYCNADSCTHTVTDSKCKYVEDSYCNLDSTCNPHIVTDNECKFVLDSYCISDACNPHEVIEKVFVPDSYCNYDGSCNLRFVYYLGQLILTPEVSGENISIDLSCEHAHHLYVKVTNNETGEVIKEEILQGSSAHIDCTAPAPGTYTVFAAARNTPTAEDEGTQNITTSHVVTVMGALTLEQINNILSKLASIGYGCSHEHGLRPGAGHAANAVRTLPALHWPSRDRRARFHNPEQDRLCPEQQESGKPCARTHQQRGIGYPAEDQCNRV